MGLGDGYKYFTPPPLPEEIVENGHVEVTPKGWGAFCQAAFDSSLRKHLDGVIGGFRWALLGDQFPSGYMWISIVAVVVLFVSGLFYFRRMERVFADVV